MSAVETAEDKNILTITLNRPQFRNAINPEMVQGLQQAFLEAHRQSELRAIVIKGKGKSFCAGGDLSSIKAIHSSQETLGVEDLLANLLQTIYKCPHPIIASVHGHAMGGGIGLLSVCDIVATTQDTQFAFSEVKLGLVPAIISVFVLKKIMAQRVLDLMLTGQVFDVERAFSIGLVHFKGTSEQVQDYVTGQCDRLSRVGLQAVKHTKSLVRKIQGDISSDLLSYAMDLLKQVRSSQEGQEGMSAFLEKRKPSWIK